MILTRYELRVTAVCPVDPAVRDIYDVTVETTETISVETILEHFADLGRAGPIYQEDLTREAARLLEATVTTVGVHSGVTTTCRAESDA